jgi:CDP-diacylglycerol--inositol 3-phosphatidyltransferase
MQDSKSSSWIVRLYYSNRPFMAFCCISCETMYLSIFNLCHSAALRVSGQAPASLVRALAWVLGELGPDPDILSALILLASIPGFILKQFVNFYQLTTAADKLVRWESKAQ